MLPEYEQIYREILQRVRNREFNAIKQATTELPYEVDRFQELEEEAFITYKPILDGVRIAYLASLRITKAGRDYLADLNHQAVEFQGDFECYQLLKQIEEGRKVFTPATNKPDDVQAFQEIAERLLYIGKRGWTRGVVPAKATGYGTWHFISVEISGGLTESGRRFVRQVEARLGQEVPGAADTAEALLSYGSLEATRAWRKAVERVASDPDGAITAARSLLETLLKDILTRKQVTFPSSADLKKLFRLATDGVELVEGTKQFSSGLQSVLDGVQLVRNNAGDAHGRSDGMPTPVALARLVVTTAGALARFLVDTLR